MPQPMKPLSSQQDAMRKQIALQLLLAQRQRQAAMAQRAAMPPGQAPGFPDPAQLQAQQEQQAAQQAQMQREAELEAQRKLQLQQQLGVS